MIRSNLTWWMMLALGVGAAACGGDDGPVGDGDGGVPALPASPAGLRVEVPPQHTPGTPLVVRWTTTGEVSGTRVMLRLGAPGDPVSARSAGYLFTGSAPATGPVWWIGGDGGLVAAEVAVADPAAASGEITLTLPSAAEGDWAVDGLLLRGDEPVAGHSATTWSASGAGLRLDLQRGWAGPDRVVTAAVDVRGTGSEPMRLSAWLTAPDGTVRSLPGLDDGQGYVEVVEGVIEPGRFELLARSLGAYGEGPHLVTVKLETVAGEVRARAGAVVQVCAAPGTVAGTVAGGGAGRLQLLDVVDDAAVAAVIDPAGGFTVEAPAGRYVVLARGAGWRAGQVIEVGCGGTVDPALTARPIAGAGAGAGAGAPRVPAPRPPAAAVVPALAHGSSTGQVPRIQVLHDASQGTVPRVLVNQLTQTVEDALADGAAGLGGGPMTFVAESDLMEAAASAVRENMNVRGNDGANATFADALDFDAVIRLDFAIVEPGDGADDDHYRVTAHVMDLRSTRRLVYVTRDATGNDGVTAAAAEVAREVLQATGAALQPLRPLLAQEIEFPDNPHLAVSLDRSAVAPGGTVNVTVLLTEASPPQPAQGVAVVGERISATGMVLESFPLVTDEHGTAVFSYVVPSVGVADNTRLDFRASLARDSGPKRSPPQHAFVQFNRFANMTLSKIAPISNGDAVGVAVQITSGTVPARQATVLTHNATYNGPRIELDAALRGAFLVNTVLQGPGKVRVVAAVTSPWFGPPEPLIVERVFYAVSPLSVTTLIDPDTRILNNRVVAVRGLVLLDGAPYVGAPVALTTAGGGVVVSGIRTDAFGAYETLYVSPVSGAGTTEITATVVADAHTAEATTTVSWGPSCGDCPLEVTPNSDFGLAPIAKGASRVFVANQDVTWTASSGTITASGVFTAPQVGGVVHVTATSVMDPSRTKLIRFVVDCTVAEATGTFAGNVTTTFGAPGPGPFSCAPFIVTSMPRLVDGYEAALTYGCPGLSSSSNLMDYAPGQGCELTFVAGDFVACGTTLQIVIAPNLDEPGNSSRRVDLFKAHPPTPIGGACIVDYRGSGILRN